LPSSWKGFLEVMALNFELLFLFRKTHLMTLNEIGKT
jgi:hypothetical protein